ncbi:unnamed protein product [Symbiodinium microadriaticum]|nr:unnamed protein product [Symbiodinium microadriaticum]
MSSLIVEVCAVTEIAPHPNADRLERVRVKGWWCIAPIGQYKVGDKCVYIPPDAILPDELAERWGIAKYCAPLAKLPNGERPNGKRVRASRFRGESSFGTIQPLDDAGWEVGQDVREHYGITKYEPPVKSNEGDSAPEIPAFHRYTGIENLANFPTILEDGEQVIVTEKIHGTNCRVGMVFAPDSDGNSLWTFVAGSHNSRRHEYSQEHVGDTKYRSRYWFPFPEGDEKLDSPIANLLLDVIFQEKAESSVIVFGEIFGAGVQDMQYGQPGLSFRVFDISVDRKYLNYDKLNAYCEKFEVQTVPHLYRGPFSLEKMDELVDGPTTICEASDIKEPFKGREGIVIRPDVERYNHDLGGDGRVILKYISETEMTWLILGLMAVIAIVIVVVLGMRTEEEVIAPAPVPVPVPEPQTTSGLGGPVFKDEEGKKTFLKYPITGSTVWVVTPHGPQLMSVDGAGDDWMDMSNGQYIAEAKLNHNYFDGIGREQSVWTVTRFTAKSGDAVRHGAAYQHRNQQFIRDEVEFWEDDTLDWLVFYWFMFDGFHEPFNYYDQYEVPALDTPEEAFVYEEPVVEEPVSDEPTEPAPVDDVPEPSDALAEVTEDQINEFNEESPPEPTPAPDATMKNAIFGLVLLALAAPAQAQELSDMDKLNELVLIRENIEMTDKLTLRGALEADAASKITESELGRASKLLGKDVTYEELKGLTGGAEPPPSAWEKFTGFFTFVNIIMTLAALMLTVAVVWLFGIHFLALILAVPAKIWEVISYGLCGGLILMGSRAEPNLQMLWVLPGCFGLVGALALNRHNWWGYKRSDDHYHGYWESYKAEKYFTHFASAVLMVAWGATAIYFQSQLLGFMAVASAMTLIGFVCGMVPGIVWIGFEEDSVIPRATFAAFCMGAIYTLAHATGTTSEIFNTFKVGLSWWGYFVFYLGILIMASKWYCRDSYRSPINFGLYASMQLLVIGAGVAALYLGSVYGIGLLLGIGGTFFGLYLMEKWFEIPWEGGGWAWALLGLSVFLYYFVVFAQKNPDYFLFVTNSILLTEVECLVTFGCPVTSQIEDVSGVSKQWSHVGDEIVTTKLLIHTLDPSINNITIGDDDPREVPQAGKMRNEGFIDPAIFEQAASSCEWFYSVFEQEDNMDKTALGDRMKWYERRYTDHVLMPMIPVLCRIDGRSFSKFTQGLARPYDERLSKLMVDTTKFLVEETNARCGYTQSDEITLVWMAENPDAEIFFGGKLLKMTSVVGSLASVYFNRELPSRIPEKADKMPVFDNRVWEVPVLYEATNCFIWREKDATRNSVQMAARSVYSHSECHNKNNSELQEMLFQKGINWNDYPTHFKRGVYVRKRTVERNFTEEELSSLPPKHTARTNPDAVVKRSVVMQEDFPPLTRIKNRDEVILFGKDPIVEEEW